MSDDAFGPIVFPGAIEAAVTATLQEWMGTYLRRMERLTGRPAGSLAAVKAWAIDLNDRFPEEAVPAIFVECPQDQLLEAAGGYLSTMDCSVSVITHAPEMRPARDLAYLYITAAAVALVQQAVPTASPVARVKWLTRQAGIIDPAKRRVLAMGQATFSLAIQSPAADPLAGPLVPDDGPVPPPDSPTISEVDVTFHKETMP